MSNGNILRLIETHLDNLRIYNDNYRQLNDIHRQYLENYYIHTTMFREISDNITHLIREYGDITRENNASEETNIRDSIINEEGEYILPRRRREALSSQSLRIPNLRVSPIVTTRNTIPRLSLIDSFLNILSPVPSIPTEREITNACTIVRYTDTSSNITECPIDLQPFQDNENVMRINGCGHIFRETNLRRYFLQRSQCPLCRYDILTRSLENSLD